MSKRSAAALSASPDSGTAAGAAPSAAASAAADDDTEDIWAPTGLPAGMPRPAGSPTKVARGRAIDCRRRSTGAAAAAARPRHDPIVIVTWNANGLLDRCKRPREVAALKALLHQRKVDVLLIQEARVRAFSSDRRDRPARSEVDDGLSEFLGSIDEYNAHWHLQDQRSAGLLMLAHRDLGPVVVENGVLPAVVVENGVLPAVHPVIQKGGRSQLAHFLSFDLLHTYVPNRGYSVDSVEAREHWDGLVGQYLRDRGAAAPPLIWAGDLNVAHRPIDSTSESFWRRQNRPKVGALYELPFPGFADAERARFTRLLLDGGLTDEWRFRHPPPAGGAHHPVEGPFVTFRGLPLGNNFMRGQGQRIDYFLLDDTMRAQAEECEILGHGTDPLFGFMGSDHCPMLLRLRGVRAAPGGGSAAAADDYGTDED